MSELHALFVGISDYFPGPSSSFYPSLEGPARDVVRMARLLRDRAELKLENTHLLLSRFRGDGPTAELPNQRPTYVNIVRAFEQLADRAAPEDRIYIHYSGHGERMPTEYPEIKGALGTDEALVPCDIGWPASRYLRDNELFLLMKLLSDRDLRVTVVLDCCYAGGHEPPITGCTLFAACRPSENAQEHLCEGGVRRGIFSHWLYQILTIQGLELSCGELHQKLMARVRGSFPDQTPMFFGDCEHRFLWQDRTCAPGERFQPSPMVLRVGDGDQVLVDVGTAMGVEVGDRLTLQDEPFEFSIRQVGATESWAEVVCSRLCKAIEPGTRLDLIRLRQCDHLAKFRRIHALVNPEPADWLEIGIEPCDSEIVVDLPCGEARRFRIVNRSSLRLDFAAFDLAPDYSVTQVLPEPGSRSLLALEPNEDAVLSVRGRLPPDDDEGIHVLKVIASVGAASFGWLEMPPLDSQPVARSGLTPSEFPEDEWITTQTEIRVRRCSTKP